MPKLFARPRSPNDNPFVESLFGRIKTTPQYPGRFLDLDNGIQNFDRYFPCYNTEHYHSGIEYVTPQQCHQGLQESIVHRRNQNFKKQRQLRKEVNRLNRKRLTDDTLNRIINPNQTISCSVMNHLVESLFQKRLEIVCCIRSLIRLRFLFDVEITFLAK